MVGRCLVCDVDFTLLFASVTLVFFLFPFLLAGFFGFRSPAGISVHH